MLKKSFSNILTIICFLSAINLVIAAPNMVISPLKISDILQLMKNQNYHSFKEINREQGIFKIAAFDANNQQVDLKVSPDTGYLIDQTIIKTKLTMIQAAQQAEKSGYKIQKIELESDHATIYYEVKALDKNGNGKTLHIDANDGKILNSD